MALTGYERLPLLNGGKFVRIRDVATAPTWWRVPLERAIPGSLGGTTLTIANLKAASGALAAARVPVIGNSHGGNGTTIAVSEIRDFT